MNNSALQGSKTVRIRRVKFASLALAMMLAAGAAPARAAGTWTKAPASTSNGGPAFGLWLLTDGTVLSHGNALNHWVKLTPDANGSYATGKWTTLASSAYARGGAQEHVLKDGRFFEAGGEYIYVFPAGGSTSDYNTVEIYDPVANTWTLKTPSPLGDIGDTGSATLSDGRIMDSTRGASTTQIYDPAADKWTTSAAKPGGSGNENSWASLQNGGVLAVGGSSAAIYNPATNKWVATGKYPAGVSFGDTAGISLMFDGRVISYGFGQTAIYTPGPTAADPGTWALGPAMLMGNEAEDEYSVTETNGKVMIATYPKGGSPNVIQEFDPVSNTMAAVPPSTDQAPYPISYLNLPNGQLMVTCGGSDWFYTPDSQPQDAWRPTVSTVTVNTDGSYTLTGTQLSGLINGGDEGDDMTMAENYPIVWLKDSGTKVYFCKSFNFSTMMPLVGDAPQTTQFTTPAGLPAGTYDLYVSSVGVQSKVPLKFTVGMGGSNGGAGGAAGSAGTGGSSAGTAGASAGTGGVSTSGAGGVSTAGTGGVSTSGAGGVSAAGTAGSGTAGTGTAGGDASSGATTGGAGGVAGTIGGGGIAGSSYGGSAGVPNGGAATAGSTDETPNNRRAASENQPGCACRATGVESGSAPPIGALLLGLVALSWRKRR
ncbi:MAG TPA: hypothetical protein VGM29_03435 [Polyangiaceae bacterium]